MILTGRCPAVLGHGVNTDLIYPGRYLKIADPAEMAVHALEGLQMEGRLADGDILVAGRNFGCGSSRTQSVLALKACGVRAVVACSFARSYFRNSINQGLPAVVCPDAQSIRAGDAVTIDLAAHTLRTPREEFCIEAYPPFLLELIQKGGLVALGREILAGTYRLERG
jgi:3-isopropylmalate/(R)-2-methylmalate dehydratase small subunit